MKTTEKTPNMSITNKRKVKVFLFILVLTSIIWLLIELSKTSISTAEFKVEYTNIPSGKLLQDKPISETLITLKAPGFSLLKYKLKNDIITFNLKNVVKRGNRYYLLPNQQIVNLNTQLYVDTEIVTVLSDTIFFDLGNNKSKKIPINPSLDIKFKLGYNLIESIEIIPDSVMITGAEKFIDSIQFLTTDLTKLEDIYNDINMELDLQLPAEKYNFTVSANKVKVIGEVDKFTEGKFVVPVTIINKPINVKINPFPREIEVVYQAGLSNFSKITKNSFLVVFDYNEYKNDTLIKYLTPVIKQKSEFIYSLKVNPNQIEFLIHK